MAGQDVTWEYRLEANADIGLLNELGLEGWELVGIEAGVCYLKRPGLSFRDRVTLAQKKHYYELHNRQMMSDGDEQ